MLTVHPIASSSAGNAILLRDGAASVLIEAGISWRRIQRGCDYRASSLDGVLISHEHGDHALAVEAALARGIPCGMSAGTAAALKLAGAPGVRLLESRQIPRMFSPWLVGAADVPHHGASDPLAFLVEGPSGDRAAYICDVAYSPYRFAGVTHWLVEANYDPAKLDGLEDVQRRHIEEGHLSIDGCIELLAANDLNQAREIWLLHMSDRHGDEVEFVRRVQAATGVPTYAAPRRTV